jgi:hypothetical protein
MAVEDFKFSH